MHKVGLVEACGVDRKAALQYRHCTVVPFLLELFSEIQFHGLPSAHLLIEAGRHLVCPETYILSILILALEIGKRKVHILVFRVLELG